MRYARLSRKRTCLCPPNRRRFASVWRRGKARLPPQRSSGNKRVRLTTSGIVSVAPTRSFGKSSPAEMIQDEMEALRAMLDERRSSQLKKS